jgi:hypothetical protein
VQSSDRMASPPTGSDGMEWNYETLSRLRGSCRPTQKEKLISSTARTANHR